MRRMICEAVTPSFTVASPRVDASSSTTCGKLAGNSCRQARGCPEPRSLGRHAPTKGPAGEVVTSRHLGRPRLVRTSSVLSRAEKAWPSSTAHAARGAVEKRCGRRVLFEAAGLPEEVTTSATSRIGGAASKIAARDSATRTKASMARKRSSIRRRAVGVDARLKPCQHRPGRHRRRSRRKNPYSEPAPAWSARANASDRDTRTTAAGPRLGPAGDAWWICHS